VIIKILLHAYFYYFLFILAVAYAENFRGGAKFRHNRVTSQSCGATNQL